MKKNQGRHFERSGVKQTSFFLPSLREANDRERRSNLKMKWVNTYYVRLRLPKVFVIAMTEYK
jgi:hypothetical protein